MVAPGPENRGQILSPTLSRRKFLTMAGVTAAGIALNACASPRLSSTPSRGGSVQLVYQDWRTGSFRVFCQRAQRLGRQARRLPRPHARAEPQLRGYRA